MRTTYQALKDILPFFRIDKVIRKSDRQIYYTNNYEAGIDESEDFHYNLTVDIYHINDEYTNIVYTLEDEEGNLCQCHDDIGGIIEIPKRMSIKWLKNVKKLREKQYA